jgi:hypothetical protein
LTRQSSHEFDRDDVRESHDDRIILELTGSAAQHGIALTSFESFVEHFRRALIDFDRAGRAERTKRGGHLTTREEQLVAFRLVGLRPGSAIVEMEPIAPEDEAEQQALPSELLALANLRGLVEAVESASAEVEPDVTESLGAARRALGTDGAIAVVFGSSNRKRQPKRVVIDERRVEDLAARRPRRRRTANRITGWLHMVDFEDPPKVGVRTSAGVEWICRYDDELEPVVLGLLKRNVWAKGHGVLTSSRRGEFTIEEIDAVDEYVQSELFEQERRPLEELRAEQDVGTPQGWNVFADPEWDDEDEASARFLETVLGPEPPH